MTWRNWGRSFAADPIATAQPQSLEQLQQLVTAHRGTGIGVKPVGSSHSFSAVAQPEGMHVALDGFRGLRRIDQERGRAVFGAGTPLHEVSKLLAAFGLALPNMGDIDRQTLAGAISTGTHGAGRAHASIGANVTAVQLVNGRGEVVDVSEDVNYEMLPAVRLGLGALGVFTEIELQCVPAFTLEADERVEPLETVVAEWEERNSADHFEFYWFPHTDTVTTKTNRRVASADPLPRARRWAEEVLLGGGGHGLASAVGTGIPALAPTINRIAAQAMARPRFSDRSDRVFVTRRLVRFRELEFGVPFDALPAALADLRRLFDHGRHSVTFPLEVRAAAADTAMLSTAFERDVAYIAVHTYVGQDPRSLFAEAQRVLLAHDGRPHWGKMHSVGHASFERLLPRFEDFLAVRDRFDPDRVFANEYTRRTLGE